MLKALPRKNYSKVKKLFLDWKENTRICSILEGNTKGVIYTDNTADPQTVFIWTMADEHFIGGNPENQSFTLSLERLIDETVIPASRKLGLDFLALLCYPLASWESKLNTLFKNRQLQVNMEINFLFDVDLFYLQPPPVAVHPITEALKTHSGNRLLLEDISHYWDSFEKFLEKGFGYVYLGAENILGHCLTTAIADDRREIGIITYEAENRQKGIATGMANAFIRFCLDKGYTPIWSTDRSNAPSIGLAEKLGFRITGEYPDFWFPF